MDLACTAADSDRHLREYDSRPSHFRVADRKVLFASGEYRSYPVFYRPDLFVYLLVPFAGLMGFHGWMLLHALFVMAIYWMGYTYYRKPEDKDTSLSALNSVLYYTLVPLPVLFLLPTHHLYLFTLITTALYFGLRGTPVISALLLGIAFSTQPWAILPAALLIGYWQFSGLRSETVRFMPVLIATVAAVFGLEFLMYPPQDISAVRWIEEPLDASMSVLQKGIAENAISFWRSPSFPRVADFLFGRTIGFFVYGAAAGCLLLSSLWLLRDRLVNRTLVYVVLVLVVVSITNPETWGIYGFVSDFWILLCAIPFFAAPIAKPRNTLVTTAIISAILVGPLLVNPLGAWTSRNYYVQAFPYRWFPSELSLVGWEGITGNPAYRFSFPGSKFYFLNDEFYPEPDFFWVHGEAKLEFLLELGPQYPTRILIVNGSEDNSIHFELGDRRQDFTLAPAGTTSVDLAAHAADVVHYEGRQFLHGTITSSSGFVPRLLSRENPDFRYLGCQVRIPSNP